MTKSPSKFTSLARLKQTKSDNFIQNNGVELSELETNAMIFEKENKIAMDLVTNAQKRMFELANLALYNDLLKEKRKSILFPLDMSKERYV